MGAEQGQRLSPLDAAFLEVETPTEHMHTAGLFIFDPPGGDDFEFSRLIALVRSRLHLVPRFRQRLAFTPLGLSNPSWADDDHFDLSYHVRHAALPRPGGMDELMEYVGRLISRQLDRERPLWELYAIEGLEDGRVAYLGKTHHAMIDGVAGIDIATLLLDAEPDPGPVPDPQPWEPAPRPSGPQLAVSAVQRQLSSPRGVVEAVQRVAEAPRTVAGRAARVVQGVASMVRSAVSPGPPSALNQVNGIARRFAIQRMALDEVKQAKNAFGTTVNDVILALVGDAVGRFLRGRGHDTLGTVLKVMVPVSVRTDDERQVFGNRVSSVLLDLPVDEMDPVERLQLVSASMSGLKQSHQAVGADFLIGLSSYAPPTLHALASRVAARARVYNFVVTNVPGPQVPLYSLGMRLLGAFPVIPLAQHHSFVVGVTSIDGWLNFGFVGDREALPDLDDICPAMVESLRELLKHAEAVGTRGELARRLPAAVSNEDEAS